MIIAQPQQEVIALDNDHPVTLARSFLTDCHCIDNKTGALLLRHWRQDFFLFQTFIYRKLVLEEFAADVNAYLIERSVRFRFRGKEVIEPLRVTDRMVAETIKMMAKLCQVKGESVPRWVDDTIGRPSPNNVIAFNNGWINTDEYAKGESKIAHPATPFWFSEAALDCRYEPGSQCPRWIKFLRESLEDDAELIALLQEWFGYCLTPDTSQQKMLWLHGKSGAGKSVTTKVLKAVAGVRNTVSFDLWDLTDKFTLGTFMGKRVAISGDAHLGRDTDSKRVIGQLKAISGEDDRLVDRKFRDAIADVRLTTRFVISCNTFPDLPDEGDALRRRALIVPFEKPFDGERDPALADKLIRELPGIVMWSLDGLKRLRENKEFARAIKADEMRDEMQIQNSGVAAFVHECCIERPRIGQTGTLTVKKERLYQVYRFWCQKRGDSHPFKYNKFCGQIGAMAFVRKYRATEDEERGLLEATADQIDDARRARQQKFQGIDIHPEWEQEVVLTWSWTK